MGLTSGITRRTFLRQSAMAAALGVLAGCAPQAESPEPADTPQPSGTEAQAPTRASEEPVTLHLIDWVSDKTPSWGNRHFAPFMEAHPHIKIEHEQTAGGAQMTQLVLTRVSGGGSIDIIGTSPADNPTYLNSGIALDLAPYIEKDGDALELDTYSKWTLEDYTSVRYPELREKLGDGQWGVPLVIFVWEFWFNTTLLQEAGLEVPERGWTWEDFVEICHKATDPSKGNYGYENQNRPLPLWPWVWQNGGEIVAPDGQLAIGSPETVEAFEFLQKLQLEDKVFPSMEAASQDGGSINFSSGRCAMFTGGSNCANWGLRGDWDFEWACSYPPIGKQEATIGEECGYIINKNSTNKDAVWEFLRYTLGPEGQKINALYDLVPNTKIMAEIGLSELPESVREVVVPLASDPMVRAYPQWWCPSFTSNDLRSRLALLWTGEKKAAEYLPALEKEFNDGLLACRQGTGD